MSMTTTTTIRKNATKKIRQLLDSAVAVVRYRENGPELITVDAAMEEIQRYEADRVYLREDVLHVVIHRNWAYSAYLTTESLEKTVHPAYLHKLFPDRYAAPVVTSVAKKATRACSVCGRAIELESDGSIRRHGPGQNGKSLCEGK